MPLPIAHGLIGASVVAALHPNFSIKQDWKFLLLGAALGVLPDFDYLPNAIGWVDRGVHHSFTHSIAFAFLAGILCAYFATRSAEGLGLRSTLEYSLCLLSHPFLDFLFSDSHGVELFWPITTRRYALNLMPPIEYSFREYSSFSFAAELSILCLVELSLCGAVLASSLIWRRLFHLARLKSRATSQPS